jgi:predicted AlkP superfamily pyrophosphatase or phosphodiesterase
MRAHLRHQEDRIAPIGNGASHAPFALAVVVLPRSNNLTADRGPTGLESPRMLRVAIAIAALTALCLAAPAAQQQPPRLVVIVVADQFRADYLTTFASRWRAGLRTLVNEGAVFRRAEYPYRHTDTCAGHFTIGTGTMPRTHGMIADGWWDPESRRAIECTDDDKAQPITYGLASKLGKSGRRLLVPTLADELRSQQSGSRVVALSLKSRSAIGLAGHAGDAVTWFEETAGVGSFMTSTAFSLQAVPAVKTFIERDPFEKEFGQMWTLRDSPDQYRFADAGVGERPRNPRIGLFPHATKGLTDSRNDAFLLWRESPFSDAYLARMAIALIDAFALGQRQATDFLGVGFSATDTVGHAFGPESREIEDTVARLDDAIGALIGHLDAKVGRGSYVLGFSADHGVAPIPLASGGGRVAGDDVRERIDDVLTRHFGKAATRWTVTGGAQPKLADGAMAKLVAQPALLAEVTRAVESVPGVDRLLRTDALSEHSRDPMIRAAALSHMPGRSGDFVVITEPNWIMTTRNGADGTTHSSPHDYDRHVPVILLGGGIKAGPYDRPATPADIAPTLAKVAQIQMPEAEGRVLQEALR